jgi:hypothetical protein
MALLWPCSMPFSVAVRGGLLGEPVPSGTVCPEGRSVKRADRYAAAALSTARRVSTPARCLR